MLDERLCPLGIAGTGGAYGSGDIAPLETPRPLLLPGEGDLNVRSVMDALLPRLCIPCRPMTLSLPIDDCEPRLIMRLVCIVPTGSGVVVADRKAAAAAAEDRLALEGGR